MVEGEDEALDSVPSWRSRLARVVPIDLGEQLGLLSHLARWLVLGAIVGVLAGASSAAFLRVLEWATDTRVDHPHLILGLPLAGLVVGAAYHYGAGTAARGNALILEEIHEPSAWVPRRMAPLVFAGTVLTHLFGGSAGREGTAIQMSGSLTDAFSRITRRGAEDRRVLLIAAIAGGFGAVFGVPVAGLVFGLEVQAVGRIRHDAIVPALTASIVGDRVVELLDVHHAVTPRILDVELGWALLAKVGVVGVAAGLVALVFSEAVHVWRDLLVRVRWAPLRPVVGGVVVLCLVPFVGRDYLGLSLPLLADALAGGAGVVGLAFAAKLAFTAITLGSGFQGGEVTPLFVIGATLGVALAGPLDLPAGLAAAVGFVAVFAGATNTPLACTIMGVELFGGGPVVLFAVACVVSYVVVGERGIYSTQRVAASKAATSYDDGDPSTLADRRRRRRRTDGSGGHGTGS